MTLSGTEGLLQEIQSGEIEEIYIHISEKAVEWAIAGFIDESNQLLQILWSYGLKHSEHLWLPNQGLQVMWQLSSTMPSNIPFTFVDIEEIESENWNRIFHPIGSMSITNTLANKPFQELSGNNLFIKAINAACQGSEDALSILYALEIYIKSDSAIGHSNYYAATAGSLLAARSGLADEAKKFIGLWGEGYKKYIYNYSSSSLMRDRATATFLLTGILAQTFGSTKEICQKEMNDITIKLSDRMANGRTLIYGNLSWHELLKKISIAAIEQKTNNFSDEVTTDKWLGRQGANEAEIKKAEERLNVLFPQDYREFLSTSDGFESLSNINPTLMPASQVDFLRKLDNELIEIWTSNMDGNNPFIKTFSNSILVGGYNEEQQLLLVPLENNKWECWFFATWSLGETKYLSFRFYIEEQLKQLEDNFFVST